MPETRSYDATVDQDDLRLTVRLSGADFIVTQGRGNGFSGFIDGSGRLTFEIGEPDVYYFDDQQHELVEQISATSALIISGRVTAAPSSTGISGTLRALFVLTRGIIPPLQASTSFCFGTAHRFEMVRR
ncbi:MAG: hypothetical protein H0W08_14590 [Acidobacteria bacterium]|nr:hypothetical protein [Acidobacteriota bacterium]